MRRFTYIFILFAVLAPKAQASDAAAPDSTFRKVGFSFGVLPAIAYDNDLGFQYGLLSNLYWYGDGTEYPRYNHSLYLECSRYAAGTMLARAYFDSRTFIPKTRFTADLTWFDDLTLDFTGFNGAESVYRREFIDEDDPLYRTRIFYKHQRQMTRLMVSLRRKFNDDSPFFWQAGATAFNMKIRKVNPDRLRGSFPDEPTLFEHYTDWGVIRPKEVDGGFETYLRGGICVDTRDNEAFPTKGVWTEALMAYAPEFLSSDKNGYGKLTVYHRQYFDLYKQRLVFAYRVALQHKLWGRTPFYLLPHWNTTVLTSATSQGLGGSKTMRGVVRNRIVGDGSFMGNAELRYIFARFMLDGQSFSIGTNVFADFGMVTQKYDIDTSNVPSEVYADYFSRKNEKMHVSSGIGLKIALNTNFVVSIDWGHALDKNDGKSGLYVLMNYLF
ncbi:MAG: BamA/TamA family outer membrane protein [Bacteroidales bacterium]|nr:BamA/TamA family outer membrane protein [Bacteroidales bacterium]